MAAVLGASLPLLAGCGREQARRLDSRALSIPMVTAAEGEVREPFIGQVPRLRPADPARDTLRLGRSYGDTLDFALVSAMHVAGDRLLVTDPQMSAHLAIIDLRSGAVRHTGFDGQGPGEFRDPNWILPTRDDASRVWVYDFQNRRFTAVPLVSDGTPPREWSSIRIDAGASVESPVWTRDGIVANGVFLDYTLLKLDSAGRPLQRIVADPPFNAQRMPHTNGRRFLNRTWMAAHPEDERLVLVYQFAPRLDFFTTSGMRYGSVQGPRETRPSYRLDEDKFFWNDDNEMAYSSVRATNRYVYALFCGCALGQDRPPSRLHVFRWDGTFVAELQVDRTLMEFTVSPDDTVLYGAYDGPYPSIGRFDLPTRLVSGDAFAGLQ